MTDDDFGDRRMKARGRADNLQSASEQRGEPLGWFEDLYAAADGDRAAVPWADGAAHPGLAEFLQQNPQIGEAGAAAMDVGCGLGDNALALQKAGFQTTAFDISNTAIEWAKSRHDGSGIVFSQADLFHLPDAWRGAFDFVHETYTIQALKHGPLRSGAFAPVADLVKPGGQLLVICRSRPDDVATDGPPWPISRAELAAFEGLGMTVLQWDEFIVEKGREIPHFRVLYERQK